MEHPSAPNHHERILTALSKVPIATTKQLATLNHSLDPVKKASSILRELEKEKLVTSQYHGRQKLWRLSKKGRTLQKVTQIASIRNVEHCLSIGDIYFTLQPRYWMYEPKEEFHHLGQRYIWNPDCIFVYERKVFVCEVQLSSIGKGQWKRKWNVYNLYFQNQRFHDAKFQEWATKKILPQFLCISTQKNVKEGFHVMGREVIQVKSIRELIQRS